MLIGIDFDNTIAGYDGLFEALVRARGWLGPDESIDKQTARSLVRGKTNGEAVWQEIQARAYGPMIAEAVMIEGVDEFLRHCRRNGVPICIVSHKTRFAAQDRDRVDLRNAAQNWMSANGFFDPNIFGIEEDHVFFEPTRQHKVARIASLGCTHFIDDLIEIFEAPAFPTGTEKILFDPENRSGHASDVRTFRNWNDISTALLR